MSQGVACRYWHTLRHLRPIQVYGRIWFRLKRPAIDDAPTPLLRARAGAWRSPAARPASMTAADSFCFLNQHSALRTLSDWNDSTRDKLWLYNLHYFDDLNAADSMSRQAWHRDLIVRWIAENPPGDGNGWEPYPLSLRIVNWIKWALAGNHLEESWAHSLAIQVRYLAARLEWHLLGNHLFANAKALVCAGLFFEGGEADRWRETGLRILAEQVPEQILADGGHFELSPMYHALILEDLLDLINLTGVYPSVASQEVIAEWTNAIRSMGFWLAAMVHPDGEIAFFNDAAIGIAAAFGELAHYADRLGLPAFEKPRETVTHLKQSGYVRVQLGDYIAFLDVGRIGPDYLPGHAHADSLSFELSLAGQRVIVNTGTSIYGTGPERQRQRSTVAHSTVEIDGESSSEVWGGFRVGRRAAPFGLAIDCSGQEVRVRCAHDGYRRAPGVTHWREWRFAPSWFSVADRLEGRFDQAISRFHIHPAICLLRETSSLVLNGGRKIAYEVNGGSSKLADDTYHPRFGVAEPSQCLAISVTDACCEAKFLLPSLAQ